ncbi:MAG: ABC transporter ATP-binding protein [Streptosporangiaceae bacterium]
MRLDEVGFRYRRRGPWVLRDVTVDLPEGRIIEVTGPNGAGKSTLLRLIAGLRRPQRGTVSARPPTVGYAPERFPTDQPFTARAYLAHVAAMRRIPADRIEDWAERLDCTPLLDVRLPELSKGSAHKVGLIQALLPEPGLLVLDEPFAGLDAATRGALPELLTGLARTGTTVLVSDHQRDLRDLPEVDRLLVTGHTVTAHTGTGTGTGHTEVEYTVIEVVVPTPEAARTRARLLAEGYDAR